jgi:hypothetical protein
MQIGRRVCALGVAVVVVAVSGCSGEPPSVFRARSALPNCGSIRPHREDTPFTTDEQRALTCFTNAHRAGTSAEITYVRLSTDGDPTRFWVRTLGPDAVEEFSHTPESDLDAESWDFAKCAGLTFDPAGLPMGSECAARTRI